MGCPKYKSPNPAPRLQGSVRSITDYMGGWREGNLGRDALGSRVGCAASLTKRHINIAMHFCHIDVGSRELRKALFFFAFLALFFFSYGPEEDQANGSLR